MSFDTTTEAEELAGGPGLRRHRLARSILQRLISCIDAGRLTVVTPSGERIDYRAAKPGPEAVLVFNRWRALRRIVIGGDIGFAEAYIDGDWSSPDLTALIALATRNGDRLDRTVLGWVPVRALNRLRHLSNINTKRGSRRNIAFHYDLGNDFYRAWLDRSMTYSSALYRHLGETLETAQQAKYQQIIAALELRGGERVLEIGCGWGALAAQLARHGAEVIGLTLSSRQLAHAQDLIIAEGVADRVELRLQDYRDSEGWFDRIVSIEMLEAVGEHYWPLYFATLRQRLKAGGKAVLQAITIAEERFDSYRKGTDFIQRYIFPGGALPTRTVIAEQAQRAGLVLDSVASFGDSYALTLGEWRRRFLEAWPVIERLGFRPSFRRLWEYYLSYCEAGFRMKVLDVGIYSLKG